MSQSDRDLVAALRAELAAIDPSRPCDRAAESAGLGSALATREAAVARLAVRLGRETAEAGRPLGTRSRSKHVRVLDERVAAAGASASGPSDADPHGPRPAFDWAIAAEHCRIAYLRGRFLARGSLSIASSRTHLEFVVPPSEAPILAAWLAEVGLPASWRLRRGMGVVTWKSAERVGTFLRWVGAGAALLELEARQVSRTLRGELNRVINAESANLHRAVAAAGRQLAAIRLLEDDGRLAEQPYVVRLVAEARRETPESTLGELAERLQLHRSAVQRALERLERLALHDDEGIGRRGAGRRGRPGAKSGRDSAGMRGRAAPEVLPLA